MTDLHTHILPGMDDGARDVSESISLLRMLHAQGVDTVALTPHFYRHKETPGRFLQRRQTAMAALEDALSKQPEEEQKRLPQLLLGAEVAMAPNMTEWEDLSRLCIGQTKTLLLELPFTPWTGQMMNEIYNLISHGGITPVITHLERYFKYQRREMIDEVLRMGVPVQITADALTRWLDRRRILSMMHRRGDWLIASDCHRMDFRPPVMGQAFEILEKRLDAQQVNAMLYLADELGCR